MTSLLNPGDAVEQAPTAAAHPCVTKGHQHRNHALEAENNTDGKAQTGQNPNYQHQYPFKQGEGLQSLAFGRKQT